MIMMIMMMMTRVGMVASDEEGAIAPLWHANTHLMKLGHVFRLAGCLWGRVLLGGSSQTHQMSREVFWAFLDVVR